MGYANNYFVTMTKDQLGHSISNPAEECAYQLDKTAYSWNTQKFHFRNRSFPNDVDSDDLPAQIIKSKKAVTKQKYFFTN